MSNSNLKDFKRTNPSSKRANMSKEVRSERSKPAPKLIPRIDEFLTALSGTTELKPKANDMSDTSKKSVNENNKRRNREAGNHQFQKKAVYQYQSLPETVIAERKLTVNKTAVLAEEDINNLVLDSATEVEEEYIPTLLSGWHNNKQYVWDAGRLLLRTTQKVDFSFDGDLSSLNDISVRPGLHTLFPSSYIGEFANFGVTNVVNRRIIICYPILLQVQKVMPFPAPEARNFDCVKRDMIKAHPEIGFENNCLLIDTLLAYSYDLVLKGIRPSTVMDVNNATQAALSLRDVVSTNSSRMLVEPVVCDFKNDWGFNQNFNVIKSIGFGFDYLENAVTRYPQFNTLDNIKFKFVNHALCRFVGHSPFAYKEICGRNMTGAFSRLLKSRPDEDVLVENQLKLLTVDPLRAEQVSQLSGNLLYQVGEDFDSRWYLRYKGWKYSSADRRRVRVAPVGKADGVYHALYRQLRASTKKDFWHNFVNYIRKCGVAVYYSVGVKKVVQVSSYLLEMIYTPYYRLCDRLEHTGYMVQLPCVKRTLYQQWYDDDRRWGNIVSGRASAKIAMKKEPGKPGKAGRFTGSFEEGCLIDKIAPEAIKYMCKEPIFLHEIYPNDRGIKFTMLFCNDQSAEASDAMFLSLNDQPPGYYGLFFSDDGFVVQVRDDGSMDRLETDLSACDSSNGISVFMIAHMLLENVADLDVANRLLEQCAGECSVSNPSNPTEYVTMAIRTFFEFSGTPITTVLNNIAVMFCFAGAYTRLVEGEEDNVVAFQEGAKDGGWTMTVDRRECFNKISFLKRSFNGQRSYLTYGPILRSIGVFEGAIMAEKFGLDIKTFRAIENDSNALLKIHLKQRVDSLKNEPVSPIINALRLRCGYHPLPVELSFDDLDKRYCCGEIALNQLCYDIENLSVGQILTGDALCAIMEVDYGVKPVVDPLA